MKNVIIFYFTGTGNTLRVAEMLKKSLAAEGVAARTARIDQSGMEGPAPDVAGFDAVGIGYPVYALNAPGMVEAFLKKLPRGDGVPAFIFKTAGEPLPTNNASSFGIRRILKKKGYTLVYERHFLMPYNILFPYPDDAVKQVYNLAERLSAKMARDLANGAYEKQGLNPLTIAASRIMLGFRPLARFNGSRYKTNAGCNLCGRCARECPAGNIKIIDGKVNFGWKCAMCMRCVMFCPKGAVSPGWIKRLAVRGPYDFDRILADETLRDDYIQSCDKGFFKLFRKYIRETEALLAEHGDCTP